MNFKLKILLGGSMLVGSWVIVILMFLRIIPLSIVLSFAVYGMSVAGLFIGMIGIFEYVKIQRLRKEHKSENNEDNRIDKLF